MAKEKKSAKIGRNKADCLNYRTRKRRERNKGVKLLRALNRELTRNQRAMRKGKLGATDRQIAQALKRLAKTDILALRDACSYYQSIGGPSFDYKSFA